MKRLLSLLIIIVVLFIGYRIYSNYIINQGTSDPVIQIENNNSNSAVETSQTSENRKAQSGSTYSVFVNTLITNGVDQIFKYSYEGKIYYRATDWEVVGADGSPEVYEENGTKIDCNFGSPMVAPEKQNPVNPICKNYAGTTIYTRK